ncbi:MAG: PglZ domain-containing protein [Ignavibacteria bacterium]
MANEIKKYVINLIDDNLKKFGLIVWYDPEEYFKDIFKNTFKDYTVVYFEGSYYELRYKTEKYFDDIEKYKLIIYIKNSRDKQNYPLIEFERAGVIFEPEGALENNSEPSVLIREAIKEIVSKDFVNEIIEKIKKRLLTLDEVQSLIDKAEPLKTGTLSLIFQTDNPKNIVLNFISSNNYDAELDRKEAVSELRELSETFLGVSFKNSMDLNTLRNSIVESLILSEFVCILENEDKNKFVKLNLIQEINQRSELINILKEWRQRIDIQDKYSEYAINIQSKYFPNGITIDFRKLISIDTFLLADTLIIDSLVKLDINTVKNDIIDIIKLRKNLYWSNIKPEIKLIYTVLELSFELILQIKNAILEIGNKYFNTKELFKKYSDYNENNAWFYIDQKYRIIENKFYELDLDPKISDKVELLINKCRFLYTELINKQIPLVIKEVSNNQLSNFGIKLQRNIYNDIVLPTLEDKKVAYILVDALRYEMGVELCKLINNSEEITIEPAIASIPTITNIGMLSLLVTGDKKISFENDKEKMFLKVENIRIKDRKDRIAYFESIQKQNILVLKLDDVVKPKKSIQDKIKEANIILITSQEIDLLNEAGNEILTKNLMSEILLNIKRAINHLSQLGVEYCIISADHGFLLGSELGKDNKIDSPNGRKYELHKRCWIGLGGDNPENTIRISGNKLGFDTDIDFVFPIGNGIFNSPGIENIYVHGGISFQEIIIPVIKIKNKITSNIPKSLKEEYQLSSSKEIITNRIFTIKGEYLSNQLEFDESKHKSIKVRIIVFLDNEVVGKAETSEYGYNENTKEIELIENKPNVITIVLNEKVNKGNLDIIMYDSLNDLEIKKLKIPINIII